MKRTTVALVVASIATAIVFADGFIASDDFSVCDPRCGAYGIHVEKHTVLTHNHGWVEDGIYKIPVDGNRHFMAAPALGDFHLEADFSIEYLRLNFCVGVVVYFRWDRAAKKGDKLEIAWDSKRVLHFVLNGQEVFSRQYGEDLPLKGQTLILDAAGTKGRARVFGADVSFDLSPESAARKGHVGFDLPVNESEKVFLKRYVLSSPEKPVWTPHGKWRFELARTQGFVAAPVYDVDFDRCASGETRVTLRLSGMLPGRPDRVSTGGGEWSSMAERLTSPYVKIVAADGEEQTLFLWNGLKTFRDEKNGRVKKGVNGPWPLERVYYLEKTPSEFTLAAGYERAICTPWRFAANGPYEQVRDKSGAFVYEGEAARRGRISFRAASPEDKRIVSRIPSDLPEHDRALKHAREQHYFFESEPVRFTLDAVWRATDYDAGEITVSPRVETVFGKAVESRVVLESEKTEELGAGLVRRRAEFALDRNPGVGVWHLETRLAAGAGEDRTVRTVFEVLPDDPNGPCPPLASGLPTLLSMPNEIKFLEESAFDPWSDLGGVSHYYAIDMRYPLIGERLQVWRADHLYRRKYFTWLGRRNAANYDMNAENNRKIMLHVDYFGGYPNGKHQEGRFDLANNIFYRFYQLQILRDYLSERGYPVKSLTPERLAEVAEKDKGITFAEFSDLFNTCWDDFKAYGKKRIDAYMQDFVNYLLSVNPKLARASYGPMPIYTARYKSPYTLEYDSHPVETDPRIRANGSFFLLEDYHYSCDYPLCRPAYFVAGYNLIHPGARRIFPEIYYQGWGRCADGAVYQAHPDKNPWLAFSHQRRVVYQYAYGTPHFANGKFGFWTDYGFHARNPERKAMDEFVVAWGNLLENKPVRPLKAPFVFADSDAFRRHGDFLEPEGCYAMVGPGFHDVRSDVNNTAEEEMGYAYERCCLEGYTSPVVTTLASLDSLTPEICEFAVLPPLGKNTPPEIVAAVRRAHERGVGIMAFEEMAGLEDLFAAPGADPETFAFRETPHGRTAFMKAAPTLVERTDFIQRFSRGKDTVSQKIVAEMRKAFSYLAPKPAVKTERGTAMAAYTEKGDIVAITSNESPIYGDTTEYPATFRFTVSAPGIDRAEIVVDAPYSVVSREKDRVVLRTRTDKDAAQFFRFLKRR